MNTTSFSFRFRTLFYAIQPSESLYNRQQQVPKYVEMATVPFLLLIIIENLLLYARGRRLPRCADIFTSISCGMISQLPWIVLRNLEVVVYAYLYDNYSVYQLPLNSLTWWMCMLGVDLGYYWVHRCAHEINFMWAGHQTHHSSEDYNLTTALRQGVFQKLSSWIFYLPMAFFISPSIFLVHLQLNLLYQFWIHTEVVDKLGPLEWILNTPSHHRVHHGVNRYCIDKNYAGVLIIWDRLFGTFEAEDEKDQVVYGLTHQIESWNPLYAQVSHWQYMVSSFANFSGLKQKLEFLLKGPGWAPGKPRLGLLEDIPDVHAPHDRFESTVTMTTDVYCFAHFLTSVIFYDRLVHSQQVLSTFTFIIAAALLLWTFTNIGQLFESRRSAIRMEVIRCSVCCLLVVLSQISSGESFSPTFLIFAFLVNFFSLLAMVKVLFGQHRSVDKSD